MAASCARTLAHAFAGSQAGSQYTGKYLAAALGVWAMGFLAVTIIGCSLLLGRKLGALFRTG